MTAVANDIWAILRELAESQKETDRKFQETDRKLKEVMTGTGKLGHRLGDFIEDAVRPAAVRLFRARGIDVCTKCIKTSALSGTRVASRSTCWRSTIPTWSPSNAKAI